MDAFKAQFERIKQQLAALTATQKMLVAALVAVMVLTMLYWGKYAGNAEMVAVLDQALSAEDIGAIDRNLTISNIPHQVENSKVLVPADRKTEILADLMYAELLPQDTHSAFELMSKQLNPFSTASERDAVYNRATQMELSQIIGHWKGVTSANVIINPKNEMHIGATIPPSATVNIRTRGQVEDRKQLARSAADGVAHAVSGLLPSQISVIIDGAAFKGHDSADDGLPGGDEYLALKMRSESELERKIQDYFHDIKGLSVAVNCEVENRVTHEKLIGFDKNKAVSLPNQQNEHTEETTNSPAPNREPGVASNAGSNGSLSIDSPGGESSTSTITDNKTTNDNFVSSSETTSDTAAGKGTTMTATVRVPTSYFAAAFKVARPSVKEPSEAEIQTFTTAKLDKIREGVKLVANLKSNDSVSVDSYEDLPPEILTTATATLPSAAITTVGGHAKEIAIAILAMVSLFLMASMVRKVTPATIVMPQLAGMGGAGGGGGGVMSTADAALFGGEAVAAEVGGADAALDGMELNVDDVRTQQMLDQVSTMVKENPDNAAALVKRWLSRP